LWRFLRVQKLSQSESAFGDCAKGFFSEGGGEAVP